MKDNNNNSSEENLGVWNDPELEARLVAMLMGELSPFEESEMALELAKSPELRLFRERMLEVKSLITEVNAEDHDTQDQNDWTLSPERRDTLLENFNTAKPERIEPEIKSTATIQWRNVFSIAACLLISLIAFMMMFLKRSKIHKNSEEMVTYSAASDKQMDMLGGSSVQMSASKSESEPELKHEVAKKPSTPSSRMAKVIAANTPKPTVVPVPELAAKEPSLDFGDGDEFGDGWGNGYGNGIGGGGGMVGDKSDKIIINGKYNTNSTDPRAWRSHLEALDEAETPKSNYAWWTGSESFKVKKENNRITGGLRSGDYSISRDGVDAFLRKNDDLNSTTGERAKHQTRAAMLMESDQAWEAAIRPEEKKKLRKQKSSGRESNALALDDSDSDSIYLFDSKKLKNQKELDALRLAKISKIKELRRIQEDKVEDNRTRLYALSKKLKIPYHGKDGGFYAGRDADANESDRATQAYEEAKRGKDQLESFTMSLDGLNDEDLRVTLLASGRPESAVLKADYEQLSELKQRKNVALANGLGAQHRGIKSLDDSIKEVQNRLDRSTANVRKKLSGDLVAYNQNIEKLRIETDKEVGDLMISAEEKTRFGKGREDYERELALLDHMKKAEFNESLGEGLGVEEEVKPVKKVTIEKITPDFTKEFSAAQQTHSTFSLNVSDVSYQLAKSVLLEKGGMPEAAKIRVEEFVNAFDYGDPSVSSACGKKVNCVVEQCAHPFFQQRNLMRIGMKTGAMGRSQPLRLTLLLDNSGSMERADRAATVAKAIEALASQLGPQDEVTLLSFARGARLVAQKVKGNQAHQLVNLVKSIPSEGGTNLSLAIDQAYTTAQQSLQDGTMSRIVLITDGAANLGNADPEELSKSIEKMRQNGIAFDACGVGADGLDDDMLEALTRKGDGRYYFINKPEDADAGFAQKLAGALRPAAKNVKVQVVFNPERVGNYRLIGFEKHRLKKEDFRNDAVDAAEMAAEEAGNALYQVEAKPDGRGDVGTVFVRFRDMASGQMVERSWVIPYEPNVKNVSSAKPSMQLATVAGMLGERLKQGEQAGIELKQLRPIYGKLRSHFHADKEVKDLLRMCEKVK